MKFIISQTRRWMKSSGVLTLSGRIFTLEEMDREKDLRIKRLMESKFIDSVMVSKRDMNWVVVVARVWLKLVTDRHNADMSEYWAFIVSDRSQWAGHWGEDRSDSGLTVRRINENDLNIPITQNTKKLELSVGKRSYIKIVESFWAQIKPI